MGLKTEMTFSSLNLLRLLLTLLPGETSFDMFIILASPPVCLQEECGASTCPHSRRHALHHRDNDTPALRAEYRRVVMRVTAVCGETSFKTRADETICVVL